MFRLEKRGVIPKLFLDLKYDLTIFASCMFGTASRLKWIIKGNKLGSICKDTENKPQAAVSVGQPQSAQPGLVPQLSV